MNEALLAGNAQFLDKARRRIDSFASQSRILALASHSILTIAKWCIRVAWPEHGRVVMAGDPDKGTAPLWGRRRGDARLRIGTRRTLAYHGECDDACRHPI